jgi:protein-glutamine gamma-glutamyltransferase
VTVARARHAILGAVEESPTAPPPSHRRPPALLPPSAARLGGFAALALLGALQWQRMIEGLSSGRAFLWVLVAVAAAAGVLWADRRRRFRGTATLAVAALSLVGAYVAAGLDLDLLKPRRLDELAAGIAQGVEALASVQMPYRGADPWPSQTLQLLGALICVLAGLLAFWPRTPRASSASGAEVERGYQFLSLALLLVLVAAPIVSIGGTEPVALGIALTALTVCFLWLERLPLKPGVGVAAMFALVLAGALPLASAADGEDPWFDYKAFAERLGPDEPLSFSWGHSYGPITWPRDGAEVLRVDARRPSYWKVADLDEFDGDAWVDTGLGSGGEATPELDLARGWEARPGWKETFRVTLRRIETSNVIAAGTTLGVEDSGRPVRPSSEPGLWQSDPALRGGDSYTVDAYVPRPTPPQLTQSSSGVDRRQQSHLDLEIPTEADVLPPDGEGVGDAAQDSRNPDLRRLRLRADLQFEPFQPFQRTPDPHAAYKTLVRSNDGDAALRASPYAETWQLARQLMRESGTPYDYVAGVNRFLQDGFTYDETPDPVSQGRAPLDGFLFETKSGYCQHYSAAMAILLRMGGIPARVVTGFSPGGYSKRKQAWIVRDTDAHSWVEAWFDEFGWVTFDPTPAGTPARSQIAALERPPEEGEESGGGDEDDDGGSAARTGGVRPDLLGPQSGQAGGAGGTAAEDGGAPWWSIAVPAGLVVLLGGWLVQRWRRRSMSPAAALDRAIAELEAALRRLGRPATAGLTLQQLERRLGRSPEAAAYLRALRAGRYAPTAAAPTPRGRRALRRELGSGAGPRGRLRALWALPPWRA